MTTVAMDSNNDIIMDGSNEWLEGTCECLEASDDFGGTGCNSSATDGTDYRWDCRWPTLQTPNSSTIVITSGEVVMDLPSNNSTVCYAKHGIVSYSGDFDITVDTKENSATGNDYRFGFEIVVGGTVYTWAFEKRAGVDQLRVFKVGTGYVFTEAFAIPTTFQTLGITRTSTTLGFEVNSVSKYTESNSGDISSVKLQTWNGGSTGTQNTDFDNFIWVDGSAVGVEIC